MFIKTKIALAAVIVLGTAVTASAATKHHVTHAHRSAIYNMVPDSAARDQAIQSGAPIRTAPDLW
jgi:hypothetical protein